MSGIERQAKRRSRACAQANTENEGAQMSNELERDGAKVMNLE